MNNFLTAELRLVKARDRAELVVPDQPLIFQYFKDQVDLFTEPTIFLYEKFVSLSRTPSQHTWEGAGYDLLSWFQWCQLKEIDWREATESDRKQFGDDYLQAASDEKTINRKLTVVRRFYDFARTEDWYRRDIGASLEERPVANRPIDEDALAHTRSTDGYRMEKDTLLLKVGRKDEIRPMQVKHLRKLLEHVGPTVQNVQDKRQVRDRLICDLGWTSGTRLGDVTTLTTLQFLNITVEPHEQLMDFPLIVEGKMKVMRKVAAPGWLVLAIQTYINGERAASEREGKKRGVKATTALFLGHVASKSAGKPITRSAIQKMFALACMKCGITEQIEVVDVATLPVKTTGLGAMGSGNMLLGMKRFIERWVDLAGLPDESRHKIKDNDLIEWRESKGHVFKSHMLRKCWAQFMFAVDPSLMPAIQLQFHHLSMAMTDTRATPRRRAGGAPDRHRCTRRRAVRFRRAAAPHP